MLKSVRRWILRGTLYFFATITIAFVALVLMLRLWILPNLDQWRDSIAASISHSANQKIVLGKLVASWQGWHPQLYIQFIRVLGPDNRPTLFLPNVRAKLSWTSLLYGELRLAELSVDNLVLSIRRTSDGTIYLAGIAINHHVNNSHFGDWLLRQHRIQVNHATLSWQDDQRSAPLFIASEINLDLINRGNHHQFHLSATPPTIVAHPIDLHGELTGKDLEHLADWHGKLALNVKGTDLAQWQTWVTLPLGITRGYGDLDLQLQVAKKQLIALTANTRFQQLSLQFAADLPRLNLLGLSGQLQWMRLGAAQSLELHQVSLRTADLLYVTPFDFYLRLAPATSKTAATGEMKVDEVQLQTMTHMATYFPLTPAQRNQLNQFQPSGRLRQFKLHWQGNPLHPDNYQIQGQFTQFGLAANAITPGFSGLSGQIAARTESGTLMLGSQHLTVDLPTVLFEPHLAFDTLTAQLHWQKNPAGYHFKLAEASFANVAAAGTLFGEYQWQKGHPGVLDLTGGITRGNGAAAYHYLPLAVKQPAYDWLRTNLFAGQVTDAQFRIKGDLANFPFHNDKNGLFEVDVKFKDGIMRPVPEFPAFDHISGDLRFSGISMMIHSDHAQLYNTNLRHISVSIPDLYAEDKEVLNNSGEATGDLSDFIRFANNSPIGKMVLDNLTVGATAVGKAQLSLRLQLPLHDILHPTLAGKLSFNNDTVTPAKPLPQLVAVRGKLNFTQSNINAQNISLRLLGGPASLSTQSMPDGSTRINLRGHVAATGLSPYLSPGLAKEISGNTDWQGQIDLFHGRASPMDFDSTLVGLTIALPQPFNKTAASSQSLYVSTRPRNTDETLITIRYGQLASAQLLQIQNAGSNRIERGAICFDCVAALPATPGLWISGHLATADLEGWGSQSNAGSSPVLPATTDVNITVSQLNLFQRQFNDVAIHAKNTGSHWQANVQSPAMHGDISWIPHSASEQYDTLDAHFKNLIIPTQAINGQPIDQINNTQWPKLMLDVDDLQLSQRHLGQLEVYAVPIQDGLRFDRILLTDSDSKLQMSALWRPLAVPQTSAKIHLAISNIGRFFNRYGHPDAIKRGQAVLDGQADWHGTPVDINITSLSGNFTLTAKNGQFPKIQPGAAKLLGILSLQELPRHIGLDFRDIFSDGFAFDDIFATMKLNHGIIYSNDFLMEGPAATVAMSGTIDMNAETQQLRASISPKLNESVALASSLVGGPVVALGVYAVQKLLKNPFGNAVRFDYAITGSWADPQVNKVERNDDN